MLSGISARFSAEWQIDTAAAGRVGDRGHGSGGFSRIPGMMGMGMGWDEDWGTRVGR